MTVQLSPPPLNGELRLDAATRSAHADDFGHIVHKLPEGVLLPESAADLARTMQWTAQLGRRFAAQGQRHSTFGRSQVQDGIVADMSTLRNIGAVEDDRVAVEAGAKWSEVLRATLAHGKTPPVLTEYIELSVGGTLIVGGVGGTTSAFGVQSGNVIDMEVVTGKGEKLTCSASINADLFDAVRAGLGQVGVITKATLKLVPAPESVRRFLLSYPDLEAMLNDARVLSGDKRFDAVQGAIVAAPSGDFAFGLDATKTFKGTAPDDDALLAGLSDDHEFALTSAAAALLIEDGTIVQARHALGGVGTMPWRAVEAETILQGAPATGATFRASAQAALRDPFTVAGTAFKVELAQRTIVRILHTVSGVQP